MVRRVLAAAAAWLLLTAQASPPPSPDPLAIVAANTLPTTIARDGRMGGAGWDALLADAQSAQFVMVGEQHGSGSIAELETALQAALVGAGFDHAALEIGPVSAVFAGEFPAPAPWRPARIYRRAGQWLYDPVPMV